MQSHFMQTNWAEENLQTIRTLMERSTLYRRALAPIVIYAGVIGILTAAMGLCFHFERSKVFGLVWLSAAVVAVAGAFLIVRRQALKDDESFWSPPTRRVAQSLLPALTVGLVLGIIFSFMNFAEILPYLWALLYGCALHSAGFFIPRGLKWFGWIYIILASAAMTYMTLGNSNINISGHWVMGFFFGVLHLVYGAYLYLTEKGKNAA
jgi:hypothetical protein